MPVRFLTGNHFGEPLRVSGCDCMAWQQRTGSVLSYNCYFRKPLVRIEGTAKLYACCAESGREVRNYFCPECGTPLYWEGDIAPDIYGVAASAFTNSELLTPTFSFWEEGMRSSVSVPDVQHFPKSGTVPG